MSETLFIGSDPGVSGTTAFLYGEERWEVRHTATETEVSEAIAEALDRADGRAFALLEEVHAMPKDSNSSAFTFGQSYGTLRGLFVAHRVPFEIVRPSKWQAKMKCRTGGDKKISRARAQELQLFSKIVHANADAWLLCELARRVKTGEAVL